MLANETSMFDFFQMHSVIQKRGMYLKELITGIMGCNVAHEALLVPHENIKPQFVRSEGKEHSYVQCL